MASNFGVARAPRPKTGAGYFPTELSYLIPGALFNGDFKIPGSNSIFYFAIDQNTVLNTPIDLYPHFGLYKHLIMQIQISFNSAADRLIFRDSSLNVFGYVDNGLIGKLVINAYPSGLILQQNLSTLQVIQTAGTVARVVAYGWGHLVDA